MPRAKKPDGLFVRSWKGTEALLTKVALESRGQGGWRAARASLILGERDSGERVWMTADEVDEWRSNILSIDKRRGLSKTASEIATGLTRTKRRSVRDGKVLVTKLTALAAAHYALGLPLPVPLGDRAALNEWFDRRFGNMRAVAIWLNLGHQTLADMRRGYRIYGGKRLPVEPPESFIRALAWLDQVGPVCPYGMRPEIELFPGQEKR